MDINGVFPSKFLRAADLQGREVTLTIDNVDVEDVGGHGDSSDVKPVVYFQGKQKGLVLNKTNANTIAGLYGAETDGWRGKPITIFPTQTEFAGKAVPCIRVRIGVSRPPAAPVAAPVTTANKPLGEDDIPF